MEFIIVTHPKYAEPAEIPESAWELYYKPYGWVKVADLEAEQANEVEVPEEPDEAEDRPKSARARRASKE